LGESAASANPTEGLEITSAATGKSETPAEDRRAFLIP
jgi:hypothetical protein